MSSQSPEEGALEVDGQLTVAMMSQDSPEKSVETIAEELPNLKPSVAQWPDEAITMEGAQAVAHAVLFNQWNLSLATDNTEPCTQAIRLGFRCYSGFGNLGSLASNDRPAILTLVDNDGRKYQATLLKLNTELATLAFNHGIETVAVQDLVARWRGHYQLLWRATPEGYALLGSGSFGPSVAWLTENLITAGIQPLHVVETYNAEVVATVKTFQRKHGLVVDGIVGRLTFIRLNSAIDKSVPRLSHQGDG